MYRVDLNSDLGESFGNYTIGMDEEILKYVSSANVACGWHAGDAMVMEKTVALAKEFGTAVGAHPGFPDLVGFGRRNMAVTPDEAKAYVRYQLGALMAFCTAHGVKIQHVKPHGALYNMAAVDEKLAIAMCEAVYEVDKVRRIFEEMHKYYEQRYTPKVKTGTRCNACSLKDICLPVLNKKKSVSGYIDRIIADEEQE